MKTARLLSTFALFIAASATLTFAQQTNTGANPPVPAGPVVMPPADQAPPSPAADQSAAPAPSPATPALPPPVNTPGTIVSGAPSSGGQDEILDIRPPLFFLISWWPWILGALAVLAFIGLVLLIWKWVSRRGSMSPKNAYDLALEKLEKARALMREDDPAPYAVAVSETIRTYLGQRFHSPSDRRTTEEFLRQMQEDTSTPLAEHAELLGAFLRACDLVKFARYQPTLAELEEVQQSAVKFVTATKPVPAAENAARPLTPAAVTP